MDILHYSLTWLSNKEIYLLMLKYIIQHASIEKKLITINFISKLNVFHNS